MLLKNGKPPSDEVIAAKVDEICRCKVGASLICAANAYLRATDPHMENGTMLYRISMQTKNFKMPHFLTVEDFRSAIGKLKAAKVMRDLAGAPEWVKDDVELIDILADLVERRVEGDCRNLVEHYRKQYSKLWLKQNRPGGLEESLKKVFAGE